MAEDLFTLILVLPLTVLVGGLVIGAMALHNRAKLRELAYKERIAMIERGLVPPPESDPAAFDRSVGYDPRAAYALSAPGERAMRHRTAGVAFLAVGLGLLLIIGFAGENLGAGIGVGGAIMVIGAAGLVNAYFIAQDDARRAADEHRRAAVGPPLSPPLPPDRPNG